MGTLRGKPEMRERIFAEATSQFLKKGFKGTVVSDITDALKVSKGVFYWYFKSKNEVLEEIVEKWDKVFVTGYIKVVRATRGGFVEKLRASHKYATEFAYANRNLCVGFLTISAEFMGSGTDMEKRMRKAYRRFHSVHRNLIKMGKDEGAFRRDMNSAVAAHVITGIHNGILLEWYMHGSEVDSRSLAKGYLDIELRGMIGDGKDHG